MDSIGVQSLKLNKYNKDTQTILIIDEIGKMECLSKKFKDALI
jgi:nucleoside-triphosphatase THEP1